MFNILDFEEKKTISFKDLAKGLRAAGLNPTESQIQNYTNDAVLIDGDQLDFAEFEKIAENCKEANVVNKEEVLNYFNSFDSNNENSLTLQDLISALCSSGDKLEVREVETLMKDFDRQNSGKISIKEFVEGIFKN